MTTRNLIAATTTTLSLIFSSVPVQATCHQSHHKVMPVREIANNTNRALALVVVGDKSGSPTSMGSGFFICKGVLATNYHIIENASGVVVVMPDDGNKYGVDSIIAVDKEHDLALLAVPNASELALPLGDDDSLQLGDDVYAIGNPEGLTGTFSRGNVAAFRANGEVIQITAPISHGSSGGPVVNDKGEIVAITVATSKSGQNINFAIPVYYLKHLIADLQHRVAMNRQS